ncbi:thioesterase superfamily protein [Alcanivorax xiamenensis]|uniref:Thioesterase superfamily protein n=1 Tax=Alcanivorax xiamenensis TaxID=1177156 RepID=A0ABQ6Y3W3_9GAMM|nr:MULTISPECIES: PaaI family thioesterase [Alcanivorax]KAF0803355.1 thioesterase superfamily protein [Alcanivorax xiamenensis]
MSDTSEILERIRTLSRQAPFNNWLNLEVHRIESGEAELHLRWRDEFAQYSGFLHAALIGGLIDTACGFAAASQAGNVTASQFSVRCLRPAVAETFVVRARVLKAGRRQVFVNAELGDLADTGGAPFAVGEALMVPIPS